MTTTTYYDLNIVEGTDIVNPLTVDNPNYQKIDETMHNNAVSGVTLATEIANATVHALNRENSECSVIRFIATSNWKAGDTMTVDGVPVTVLLPSGETLPDGAYVINANVLCTLTGTNLTVYADRKKTDTASEIKYNDTNVAVAITKINSNLSDLCKRMEYGRKNIVGISTTMQSITINFEKSFDSVPIVLISPEFVQYNGGDNLFKYVAVDNVTPKSFTVVYKATQDSQTWPWHLSWIAVL